MNKPTASRFANEIAVVEKVSAVNPDQVKRVQVIRKADGSPAEVQLLLLVRTAIEGPGPDEPRLDSVPVQLSIPIGMGYPKEQPEVRIASPVPLYVGAVLQAPGPAMYLGVMCPMRNYDWTRNTCLQLLINAWNALTGLTFNSETDCINKDAARHWLLNRRELPFDGQLVLPAGFEQPGSPAQDFDLEEAPA